MVVGVVEGGVDGGVLVVVVGWVSVLCSRWTVVGVVPGPGSFPPFPPDGSVSALVTGLELVASTRWVAAVAEVAPITRAATVAATLTGNFDGNRKRGIRCTPRHAGFLVEALYVQCGGQRADFTEGESGR